jgi:hypothetical protein
MGVLSGSDNHAGSPRHFRFRSPRVSASNALCILGMGSCNGGNGGIDGEYVRLNNPNTKLTIDASKIAASQGPMTIAADYTVRSVEGNQILSM